MTLLPAIISHGQAPLPPSAGGAGYALRLQGQQCLDVNLAGLEEHEELAMGVWLNPSQVRSCCEPPKLPFWKERQAQSHATWPPKGTSGAATLLSDS